MKLFCLRLAVFFLMGTALMSLFSQKASANDSYGLTWTVTATPSAVAVDLSHNVYYAGFVASGSAIQMNPLYQLNPTNQPSDTKVATVGGIFLSKINANLTYSRSYIIEADDPKVVNGMLSSISLTKIATDSAQNVYLLGSFNGNVNFDPTGGSDFHNSNGQTWSFLTEIKADGTYGSASQPQDLREIGIALYDPEFLIDQNDCAGDLFHQCVGFLLGELAHVGDAHHLFRLAVDQGFGKFPAVIVAAAAAVEFVFRAVFAHRLQRLLNDLIVVFLDRHGIGRKAPHFRRRHRAWNIGLGILCVIDDLATLPGCSVALAGLRPVHAPAFASQQFEEYRVGKPHFV